MDGAPYTDTDFSAMELTTLVKVYRVTQLMPLFSVNTQARYMKQIPQEPYHSYLLFLAWETESKSFKRRIKSNRYFIGVES